MKRIISLLILLGIFAAFSSCEKKTELLAPENQETKILLDLKGFQNVGDNAQYCLWSATDGELSRIGNFTVNDAGVPSQDDFDVNLGVIQKSTTLVITIETADSLPDFASTYSVIAAKLKANDAEFSVGDDYLLKFDVSSATASYQLVKASDSDAIRGIWFMNGDTLKEAGLQLPDVEAATGWRYEAYVIVNGDSLAVGFFRSASGADRENIYGDGSLPTFPFPGENFIVDPVTGNQMNVDLRGAEVVVKIIPPVPGFSKTPFKLDLFKGTIPANAQGNTTYQLENNSSTFPGGIAKLIIKIFE